MINETKKVLISVGKVQEHDFIENVDIVEKCLSGMDNDELRADIYDMAATKLSDLTVGNVMDLSKTLASFVKMSEAISNTNMASIFLYTRWLSDGDKITFKVDPERADLVEI